MQSETTSILEKFVAKPPKRRFQPRDLGTDRSRMYNATHSGHNICNNAMLDRYLKNRNDLINMGVRVDG